MGSNRVNVLYVDDEENNLHAFIAAFRRDFEIFTAISAERGKAILAAEEIHVLITDQRMPGETGTQLLKEAVEKFPDPVRILLTAYADLDAVVSAINEGYIFRYLRKPWNETELKESIELAFENYKRLKELKEKAKRYEVYLADINKQLSQKQSEQLGLDDNL